MLVGREPELDRLVQAVDAVAGGSGRFVLLAGEPGVGKTRLAQEATIHLRNRRFQVAAGRCYEPRQTVAFYPFVEALAALFSGAPPVIQSAVPSRWPYLGRLLPDDTAGALLLAPTVTQQDEHERLLWAVKGFVQALAAELPVAILLDDVHWADSSSLELLQHLARHTRADRVLLLGTYRDVEVGRKHPLEQALRDLNREGLVERMPVQRLDRNETAALLASSFDQESVSDDFVSLMHRQTDGNPFYVQEVLRSLVDRGEVYLDHGRWERREISELTVPESVRSAVGDRLSRLSQSAQEILASASVLGQTFDFDELQSLTGDEEDTIESILQEAITSGLVTALNREQYGFNHALTQHALYEELPARRRRRLHLAAGETLDALPKKRRENRAAEIAWHFLEGDDAERALPYTILAGDGAAAVFAFTDAERHYGTALKLMSETDDSTRLAEVLKKLGTVLVKASRYTEALEPLDRASSLFAASGDFAGRAGVEEQAAQAHFGRQTADAGLRRLESHIAELEERVSPAQLARLYDLQAQLLFGVGRYDELLRSAQRTDALARQADDDHLRIAAEGRLVLALLMLGRTEEACRVLEDAIPRAEAAVNLDASWLLLVDAAEIYEFEGALELAMRYRMRALDVAERLGDQGLISLCLCSVAQTELLLGRWESACRNNERAARMTESKPSWYAAYPRIQNGEILYLQGEIDAAAVELDAAIEMLDESPDVQSLRYVHRIRALVDLELGHPDAAVRRIEPLLDRMGSRELQVDTLVPVLAEALLATGQGEAAVKTARDAVARTGEHGDRLFLLSALDVRGKALAQLEQWDAALADLHDSAAMAHAMSYPFAEARALYDLGYLYVLRGQHDQAETLYDQAHAIFTGLGARRFAERCAATTGSLL